MSRTDRNGDSDSGQPEGTPSDVPRDGRQATVQIILRQARRLVVLVVGTTVLLLGIVLLVTPGPAFVVIPIGLAILSIEFAWAQALLRRVREGIQTGVDWRDREEWKWLVGLRKHRRSDGESGSEG